MPKELPTTRVPLSELPLADFVRDPNLPLSPVSLPLKRPATPKLSTPKRQVLELDADELGTGRSPARRLFDTTPRASKSARTSTSHSTPTTSAGPSGTSAGSRMANGIEATSGAMGTIGAMEGSSRSGSTHTLAPSPPLGPRRPTLSTGGGADQLPTPAPSSASISSVSSTSSSTTSTNASSTSTPSSSRIHDPGFVVFSDDDPAARPRAPAVFIPVADSDEENIPPLVTVEIETPRRKRFEPSKLSTVTNGPSEPISSGKRGMIAEADMA